MIIFKSVQDPRLVRSLHAGAVGILPTDTIYGVVVRALDPRAVARLYAAKNREGKPGTVIAATTQQLRDMGIKAHYIDQVAALWPNPLSVVLPDHPKLTYLDQGKQSLAVRVPADEVLTGLLLQTGPLLTSSANMPGQPPAESLKDARRYFGDKVDFYVDAGTIKGSTPSTIIRLTSKGTIEILRRGALQLD